MSASAPAGRAPQADGDLPNEVNDLLDRARALLHSPPDTALSPLAIELCRRALQQAPGHPIVASALARAFHAHGKSDDDCTDASRRDAAVAPVRRVWLPAGLKTVRVTACAVLDDASTIAHGSQVTAAGELWGAS